MRGTAWCSARAFHFLEIDETVEPLIVWVRVHSVQSDTVYRIGIDCLITNEETSFVRPSVSEFDLGVVLVCVLRVFDR
jgi:hypothetical protein